MQNNLVAAAVVAVGLILAASFGRYQIIAGSFFDPVGSPPTGGVIYRIDRLTGEVEACVPWHPDVADLEPKQPSWCAAEVRS